MIKNKTKNNKSKGSSKMKKLLGTIISLAIIVLVYMVAEGDLDGKLQEFLGEDSNTNTGVTDYKSAETEGYEIPEFTGEEVEIINDNIPYFTEEELNVEPFETFSPLDDKGRVGTADALLTKDMMPTETRTGIGNVYPSGWEQYTYINNNNKKAYLYNRSHLIGHQFTGQNDNELNLMTGTRKFNHPNMSAFEDEVAKYIKDTNNTVRYRVTPAFKGEELVARGIFLEAKSIEDDSIEFNIFLHNVEEGFKIDYNTGQATSDKYQEVK